MAAPNLMQTTTISGKTAVQSVVTGSAAFLSNASDSGKVLKINSIIVSNIDGTASADITVDLFRASVAYNLAWTIPVPADSTLILLSKEAAIYLEEGDSLRSKASANGDLQIICSYEEIS